AATSLKISSVKYTRPRKTISNAASARMQHCLSSSRCETSVPSASVSCSSTSGVELALELSAQLHGRAARAAHPGAELARDACELARAQDEQPDEEEHRHLFERHAGPRSSSTRLRRVSLRRPFRAARSPPSRASLARYAPPA